MTNEWLEFKAYTEKQKYSAASKHDLSYLGRFSFKTITDFEGFGRILTVIARGYIFHNKNGSLFDGDPYTRIEYARNALCAWCSIPDKNDDAPFVNFGELSADYPELVNSKGEGWYYRHIQNIVKFVKKNPTYISEKAKTTVVGIGKGFKTDWKKKVRQLQVPIFALNTKAAWALRFDDIIADALELGALRMEEYILPPEKYEVLQSIDLNGVPLEVVCDVVFFYEANKTDTGDWVVLPIANFDCYYGNTNFSKKWLSKIPDTILTREVSNGISRVKVNI
ncbi:MAG: hypothetical protein II306_05120 [Clostridia bacterium]|nr:hypothetical protein [Clostridia bacterium]MBQ5890920.1 hypothetical protein [Clostridia bacterium]MEE0967765.1 hypothetical protein [Clostridia bacterium]